jgi:hypothetical protein
VTIGGGVIGSRIYWSLDPIVATIYKSVTHGLVYLVTVFTKLLGNVFQRRKSPYSEFSNYPPPQLPASDVSQLCLPACLQTLDSLVMATRPRYTVCARTAQEAASNNYCIVVFVSVATITSQLPSHCLATSTEHFSSSGSLLALQFWLSRDLPLCFNSSRVIADGILIWYQLERKFNSGRLSIRPIVFV